jgi:putative cell wall-binding protein
MKTILYIITALLFIGLVMATPLSITDSNYITFDSGLAGPAWQIIVRGDNSADYVLFAPAAQITGTKDNVPVQAKNNFQLSTSIEQELCRYQLYDTVARTDIYKYEVVKEANDQAFWL